MGNMEEQERELYPSDLTDEQWEEIALLYHRDVQLHVGQTGIGGYCPVFGGFGV